MSLGALAPLQSGIESGEIVPWVIEPTDPQIFVTEAMRMFRDSETNAMPVKGVGLGEKKFKLAFADNAVGDDETLPIEIAERLLALQVQLNPDAKAAYKREGGHNKTQGDKAKSGDAPQGIGVVPFDSRRGNCGNEDSAMFISDDKSAIRKTLPLAKSICSHCVLITSCRKWGRKHHRTGWAVYGGELLGPSGKPVLSPDVVTPPKRGSRRRK